MPTQHCRKADAHKSAWENQAQVLKEARARHMNTARNLSSTHLSHAATWKYRRLKSKQAKEAWALQSKRARS